MSKRTLLMLVALIASLALVATGTLAYLTDTDSDVNVMTLGNVAIKQLEKELDVQELPEQRLKETGIWQYLVTP